VSLLGRWRAITPTADGCSSQAVAVPWRQLTSPGGELLMRTAGEGEAPVDYQLTAGWTLGHDPILPGCILRPASRYECCSKVPQIPASRYRGVLKTGVVTTGTVAHSNCWPPVAAAQPSATVGETL
jgi:hypothetical protein